MHRHLSDARAKQIQDRLGGTFGEAAWLRTPTKSLSTARAGDRGLIIDMIDGNAAAVQVLAARQDGRARVIAYEPLFARASWAPWNGPATAKAARASGLTKTGLRRDARLTAEQFKVLAVALHGPRAGRLLAD